MPLLIPYGVLGTLLSSVLQVYRWQQRRGKRPARGQSLNFRRLPTPGLRISIGSMFILFTLPFLFETVLKTPGALVHQPTLYLELVFPRLGIRLLMSSCRGLLDSRRKAQLVVDSPQPCLSQFFLERFVSRRKANRRPGYEFTDCCQKIHLFRWRSGWQWFQEKTALASLLRGLGPREQVAFQFRISPRICPTLAGAQRATNGLWLWKGMHWHRRPFRFSSMAAPGNRRVPPPGLKHLFPA